MPHTKAKPVQPIKADRKPQSGSKPGPTEQVRAEQKERLQTLFEQFVNEAWPEEIRFMNDVLADWDSNGGGNGPRKISDAEVPIYSAVQVNLNSKSLVEVPFSHVGEVQEFIATLDCIGWPERPRSIQQSDDELRTGLLSMLDHEVKYFHETASTNDARYLLNTLERWANDATERPLTVIAGLKRAETEAFTRKWPNA